jgi:phage FluMu gp28-like protein
MNWKRVLELVDPVTWVHKQLGFDPWDHQKIFLQDAMVRTRVVRKSRQVGMTTAIAYEAVWKAFNSPHRTILIISPGLRQSLIPMKRIHAVIESTPQLGAKVRFKSKDEIQLHNGSSILALPNNPDRIRGYAADDIYLDEAAHFLNDEPIMRAVEPMRTAKRGTITIISTPFGKRGLFWNAYNNALQSKESNIDVRCYDFFPSTINPKITKAMLDSKRQDLSEIEFKQEYYAEFIAEVDVYLPLELILSCVNNELTNWEKGEPGITYYMGVDLAKQRDETVVIILEKNDETSKMIIRHISAWSKMDYTEQISKISRLSREFPIFSCAIDQTGVGEPILEQLKSALPDSSVDGVTFTQKTKNELIDLLRINLEQKRLELPNDSKLIMQMNSQRYTFSSAGNKLFPPPGSDQLHDDYLWALCLAVHSAQKRRGTIRIVGAKRTW